MMKKFSKQNLRERRYLLRIAVCLTLVCIGVYFFVQAFVSEPVHENTLPSLHITSSWREGRSQEEMRFDWHPLEEVWITGAGAYDFGPVSGAEIRGRGNSSWWAFPERKQPFRIRFNEPNRHVSLLDSGHTARHWTFIANHSDRSLMRNYSAYFLASQLDGMSYAPFARFVHVYENGEYRGVYMLCVQLSEVREGRIELTGSEDPALSEYLIEMCMRTSGESGDEFFTVGGMHYEVHFPSNVSPEHNAYLHQFFTRIYHLLREGDPAVFDYIHLESFVDFMIVQDLYKNPDVHFSSMWMQLRGKGEERRLEMGPVWDFDIAAGNAYYQGQHYRGQVRMPPGVEYYPYGYSPYGPWVSLYARWYRHLMEMPEFATALYERWSAVRDEQVQQTIDHIWHTAVTHQGDFERNFRRWGIMRDNIWPNPTHIRIIPDFMGHVEQLTDFLERRAGWLDEYYRNRALGAEY